MFILQKTNYLRFMVTQQPGKWTAHKQSHASLADLMPVHIRTPCTREEATVPADATRWQSKIWCLRTRAKILVIKTKFRRSTTHILINRNGHWASRTLTLVKFEASSKGQQGAGSISVLPGVYFCFLQ